MPRAQRLSIAESLGFLPTFLEGLLSVGLIQPLESYAAAHSGALAAALTDWAARMRDGESPEAALAAITPRLAAPIERVLTLGFATSDLDIAVRDLIALDLGADEDALRIAASGVVEAWENRPGSSVICGGCLERELHRLVARAAVEHASEVIVAMIDDRWMQQSFVGPKLVRLTEPSARRTFDTIREAIRTATELSLNGVTYVVAPLDGGHILAPHGSAGAELLIRFRA